MSSPYQQEQQQQQSQHELLLTVRRISLLLGFVIALLSQLATFATNFIAIYLARGEETTKTSTLMIDNNNSNSSSSSSSKTLLLECGLMSLSALGTTMVGMIGLFLVRYLLRKYIRIALVATTTTTAARDNQRRLRIVDGPSSNNDDDDDSSDDHSRIQTQELLLLLMDHVDNRLVVGSLLGVAVAWMFTDFLLMDQAFDLRHCMLVLVLFFFQFEGARLPFNVVPQRQENDEEEEPKKERQFEEYVALV